MNLYLVRQLRFGNEDGHTYISHVTDNKDLADYYAVHHGSRYRGGKYEGLVVTHIVSDDVEGSVFITEINNNQRDGAKYEFCVRTSSTTSIILTMRDLLDSRTCEYKIESYFKLDKDDLEDGIYCITLYPENVQKILKDLYEESLRDEEV